MKTYSNLESIYSKHGIELKNDSGDFRHVVDVLEDIYIKISSREFIDLGMTIAEEELHSNIFDESRGRKHDKSEY